MKRILITGGAGFLGSHIADKIIKSGHEAIIIDDLSGGTEANVPANALFFVKDICDEAEMARLFHHIRFDAVVHCAAFASENLSHNCRMHTYRSVVLGSANLVNAAVNHGVGVFVSMSSIAAYGHQNPPFVEHTPLLPADPYGAAKLCMERDLQSAHDFFGLNYAIFRPHNIIGIRQSLADTTRNVASIFIRQVLTGEPLTVFGDGSQTRAFSPVSHVAGVIAACVDRPATWNTAYNIGGDQIMSVLELANSVCALALAEKRIVFLPERKEAKFAHSSHEKVKVAFPDLIGHETIAACLEEMISEARKMQMPPTNPLPSIEIHKNLNPAWTPQI